MPKYECDKCGACCEKLIIEIDYTDVLREPRIREHKEPLRIPKDHVFLDEDDKPIEDPDPYMAGVLLVCGNTCKCPFFGPDRLCQIYPTRPNVCVGFPAGGPQCQDARQMAGLEPLQPVGSS